MILLQTRKSNMGATPERSKSLSSSRSQDKLMVESCNQGANERSRPENPLEKIFLKKKYVKNDDHHR